MVQSAVGAFDSPHHVIVANLQGVCVCVIISENNSKRV